MSRSRLFLSVAAASALLAACAVGPAYQAPDLALTQGFHTAAPPSPADAPAADMSAWWRGFGDPEMTRVVERAAEQNLDLAQARARVLQSRAAARAAGAALLPQAEARGSVSDVRQSLLSPIGGVAHDLPGFHRDYDLYDLGAAASWEIDLFGGLKRGHEAAEADALASQNQAEAIRLSIAAEAADAYLQLRAYQARLEVARGQEEVQQDLVALLERRTREGVSPERELNQARAALEGVRASIPPLLAGEAAELNRLDVLMGAQPGTYQAEVRTTAAIPTAPAVSAADGPSGLLRRRPDLIAAEQKLVAANARIGEAVSGYYPKLSISGLLGVESVLSSKLFDGEAVQHSVGAGLRWRLFDFGRVDAEVAAAKGKDAEALAAYRAAVLKATEEVETAFSDLAQQQTRADALTRQIIQLTKARAQAGQAYEEGVINLIEVRDTDRELLTASDQLAQAKAGAARAAVACFRALGGGWDAPASRIASN
jgi:NodT family efflux transporter outer membrane factor (OMF) lipoprotein